MVSFNLRSAHDNNRMQTKPPTKGTAQVAYLTEEDNDGRRQCNTEITAYRRRAAVIIVSLLVSAFVSCLSTFIVVSTRQRNYEHPPARRALAETGVQLLPPWARYNLVDVKQPPSSAETPLFWRESQRQLTALPVLRYSGLQLNSPRSLTALVFQQMFPNREGPRPRGYMNAWGRQVRLSRTEYDDSRSAHLIPMLDSCQ